MGRIGGGIRFASLVVREVHDRGMKYPAAAIAYYTFVASLPLSLLVFVVLGEQIAGYINALTPAFLTPETQRVVDESLTVAAGRTGASILAIVVFAWAAVNIVAGFHTGLVRVDGEHGVKPIHRKVRDGVIVLGSIVLGIATIGVASALPSLFPDVPLVSVFAAASLPIVLTLVFLPMYVVLTRSTPTVRSAVPGAIVGATGWTLLQTVLRVYAENAGRYAVYGVLSGVILFLTSLYLGALVLMTGAVVNALLSHREGRA